MSARPSANLWHDHEDSAFHEPEYSNSSPTSPPSYNSTPASYESYQQSSDDAPDYEELDHTASRANSTGLVYNIKSEGIFECGSTDSLELSNDPVTRSAILQSSVSCIHRQAGCGWSGQLGRLKGHLNTCQKDAVGCLNQCGAKIARVMMEDHMLYTCSKRLVNCLYCRRPFTGAVLEDHQAACGFEPLYCENKCGQRVARNRLKAHQVNTCSKRLVGCKYCGRSFTADTLQGHHVKCNKFPVPCPNRCGDNCPREDVERHLADCERGTEPCPHAEAGCRWKGAKHRLDRHINDNASNHLDLTLAHSKRQAEYILKLKQELERASTSYTGTLVWKVKDVKAKMEESKDTDGLELVSLPFYTSQCGYKLQASLFLNGNGGGEDSHLSIYIKILPGEFDSILKWPFRHTVSFSLLDQNPDRTAAVNIVESFLPDPTWPNFCRPSKQEDKDQLGFGFPKFVPHAMLKLRDYVKDDTLFIRIKADPNKGICV